MSAKWKLRSIGQAPLEIIDGDRGDAYPKHGDFIAVGYCLFLNAKNVTSNGFDFSDCQFISEQKDEELHKGKLVSNDIVLTTRGTLGNAAFYGNRIPINQMRINSGMVIIRTDASKLIPLFLYGYLRTSHFQGQVAQLRSGVAQPQLPIRDLRKITIPLPSVEDQEKIAKIFSAYDNLIGNNRKRIALLTEFAQELYKEWFVRFRFPGYKRVRITDGVPEGWERKSLVDAVQAITRGITPQYDDFADSLVINQKCIREGRLSLELARRQKREVPRHKVIQLGDILINSTGEGTLGRVVQIRRQLPNCTVDSHVTIVRPVHGAGKWFLGYAISHLSPILSVMGRGATNQTELSQATIAEMKLLIPNNELVQQFETIVGPIINQSENLAAQNSIAREALDMLLPKLMSRKIEIKG